MYKITIIAGARPNFIKIAPIMYALKEAKEKGFNISYRLVHTGQHYDKNMSDSFFEQLSIPEPNTNLECSGGSQAEQTASILLAFEKELKINPADLLIVVGDVTSTMACTLVAKKNNVKVAHVEGGIRSGDMTMPEEINRIVTDSIADYFFTTSELANQNLIAEGVDKNQLFLVGNTMIDTLLKNKQRFFKPEIWGNLNLRLKSYVVLTMHRPANVDAEKNLEAMLNEIILQTKNLPIIFPAHPRTQRILSKLNIESNRLHIVEPLSYLEFNYLVKNAKAVITDSGGITEEASIMNVPCLTLRDNTERPETITLGTNELIGTNPKNLKTYLNKLFDGQWKQMQSIPFWDGKTAERIVKVITNNLIKN
ncbi:UDP-N-acetylglucosamine 2-epimerase (non-hydrolyzing) [Winogradskyella sp. PC-19]|uniref:non-hydrolyzing UDP-N-acetylglucosamine 2-epimerase n=1 Tax=unclassified Winogradskyella TaxID=2615021 RepID=UPI000B3BFD3D|nr:MULTISPECIES: UDP-N-acetylglucosamine 2-epimerase (non-hydrolyzing) [unclassified Winogradskyella]ARV10201.1 UDP-N-acetylglucosamine 2-epimerase (non-hydrolyzing) [Winogradskyella sp. PC-19]